MVGLAFCSMKAASPDLLLWPAFGADGTRLPQDARRGKCMGAENPLTMNQSGMPDNVASALAYLTFIPAILFLTKEPYNRKRTVRFHAWQCIYLTITWIFINAAMLILQFVPGIGWSVVLVFEPLLDLAFVVMWIYLMINTFNGRQIKAPIVGEMAEKRAAV
jgi:uncharacterized membrane protein